MRNQAPPAAQLWLERPDGTWRQIPARIENNDESGFGVVVSEMLTVGCAVLIEGGGRTSGFITWCAPGAPGEFRAGISLEDRSADAVDAAECDDYYETLEVNPMASFDTIHKIYRVLAQRLHPDNIDSGDEQGFRNLVKAYGVLSDPERRAAFDVERSRAAGRRWRIFDPENATPGLQQEQRKRRGILSILYNSRMRQAGNGVGLQELEHLLAVPREHLEFPLWFLKEQGWVHRSDGGKHQITAKGVEYAESTGAWQPPTAQSQRLLSTATRPSSKK